MRRLGLLLAVLSAAGCNAVLDFKSVEPGTVTADGHDIVRQAAAARSKIGLVPQELSIGGVIDSGRSLASGDDAGIIREAKCRIGVLFAHRLPVLMFEVHELALDGCGGGHWSLREMKATVSGTAGTRSTVVRAVRPMLTALPAWPSK